MCTDNVVQELLKVNSFPSQCIQTSAIGRGIVLRRLFGILLPALPRSVTVPNAHWFSLVQQRRVCPASCSSTVAGAAISKRCPAHTTAGNPGPNGFATARSHLAGWRPSPRQVDRLGTSRRSDRCPARRVSDGSCRGRACRMARHDGHHRPRLGTMAGWPSAHSSHGTKTPECAPQRRGAVTIGGHCHGGALRCRTNGPGASSLDAGCARGRRSIRRSHSEPVAGDAQNRVAHSAGQLSLGAWALRQRCRSSRSDTGDSRTHTRLECAHPRDTAGLAL